MGNSTSSSPGLASVSPPAWQSLLYAGLGAGLLVYMVYGVERTQFEALIISWTALFGLYGGYTWRLGLWGKKEVQQGETWKVILAIGILFRLIILFALPNLSDDYFRFVWDGLLWNEGINPFAALPSAYMEDPVVAAKLGLTQELYEGLNSPNYYTIYPPVLQLIFWLGTFLFPNSLFGAVMLMKSTVFLAEVGSLILIIKLLESWGMARNLLAWYALNPLVIVELTGNLHFEALMIFFLLGSLYLWQKATIGEKIHAGNAIGSATFFALAVCSKLLPLMLLPLWLRRAGFLRSIAYGAWVAGLTVLLFSFMLTWPLVLNLSQSIDLYFHNFEFNASIFYLVRWVGFEVTGYNVIKKVGTWLALCSVLLMLAYLWREKKPQSSNLPTGMMWYFAFYFAFASIVHPWYATTLVALASFSRFRWPMLWTAFLPLTYFTYLTDAYIENLWLTSLAYGAAYGLLIYELSRPVSTPK